MVGGTRPAGTGTRLDSSGHHSPTPQSSRTVSPGRQLVEEGEVPRAGVGGDRNDRQGRGAHDDQTAGAGRKVPVKASPRKSLGRRPGPQRGRGEKEAESPRERTKERGKRRPRKPWRKRRPERRWFSCRFSMWGREET